MTNESNLKVVWAGWDELPGFAKWDLGEVYKIKPEEYRVYADMRKGKRRLYVYKDMPEKDIVGFVDIATCTGSYSMDEDSETGRFMDYVYKTYGESSYFTLRNARMKTVKVYREKLVSEKVEAALDDIRAMDEAGICGDLEISDEAQSKTNAYIYYMGYLDGLAEGRKEGGGTARKEM